MLVKSPNARGTRSIRKCKNCGKEFSELNTKIRQGGGIFCSRTCHTEYRKKNSIHAKKDSNIYYQKKNKYGLSKEEYLALFEKQGNKCAICGIELTKDVRPCVDHNHETNKVRGILCTRCNSLLGFARENIDILKGAIKYLKKNYTKY